MIVIFCDLYINKVYWLSVVVLKMWVSVSNNSKHFIQSENKFFPFKSILLMYNEERLWKQPFKRTPQLFIAVETKVSETFTTCVLFIDVVAINGWSDAAVKVIRIITWNTFFVVVGAHLLETTGTSASGSRNFYKDFLLQVSISSTFYEQLLHP